MRQGFLNNFGRNPCRHDVVQSATCTSWLARDVAIATTSFGCATSRKSLENVCRDFDSVFDLARGCGRDASTWGGIQLLSPPAPRRPRDPPAQPLHASAPEFTKDATKPFAQASGISAADWLPAHTGREHVQTCEAASCNARNRSGKRAPSSGASCMGVRHASEIG